MTGKITFVGAGPGAPDLITLRGAARLASADLVIYAGSLVNEKLLELAPHARCVNSAKIALHEVIALMRENFEAGRQVVRLHTGDPAIYGAVAEQYRELDALGIPYEVVPGVSSAFAAAAELKVELTMPGLSQSVILTREAGRTPVPPGEELEKLASHGTTLCIFLSVSGIPDLCRKLVAAGRPPETPAAVVYRASWPNQTIIRGTLADLAAKVEAAGIHRQSMIVVGDILNRSGELSCLYDRNFSHGYRSSDRSRSFQGKTAIFALTARAACKAAEIAAGLDDAVIVLPEKHAELVPAMRLRSYPDGGFGNAFRRCWNEFDGLVMVMAAGIVIRHVIELCESKLHDPAVVVCDERGTHAISLLSGHLGGANRLASDVARITGGEAVITTASDLRRLAAFDEVAARYHYKPIDPAALTGFAAALLEDGEEFDLEMPPELFQQCYSANSRFHFSGPGDGNSFRIRRRKDGKELVFRKRRIALGIGCRRNVAAAELRVAAQEILEKHGFRLSEISCVASADVKKEETGLREFAEKLQKRLEFFSANELNAVEVPDPSPAAEEHLGIRSVSEAAALLAAGPGARLVIPKTSRENLTVALAMEGDEND